MFLSFNKEFIIKHRSVIILSVLAIVFFFVYSYLSLTTPLLFNSPDETANFVFIKQWVETGQLKIGEPLNQLVGNIIHPRSVNVTPAGDLVPGGFLGLILLYGFLAKIFGLGVVKFLTPFFSAAAVLFFYGLIKKIFNEKIALMAAVFLFITPAFWYYASRGLLPNVLFIDLLVIGFYFLLLNKHWAYGLAGLFFGVALSVRMIDGLWLIPLLIILLIIYRKKLKNTGWWPIILMVVTIAAALLPNFYYQQKIYGDAFKSGYSQLDMAPMEKTKLITNLFPFGFHPRLIIKNFYNYYLQFFWWLFLPFLAGFLLLIKKYREITKRQKIFLWLNFLISVFLIIYYGSGLFSDNLTPWRITIGDSHLRYWLPVYLLALPFVAYFLLRIKNLLPPKIWLFRTVLGGCLLLIIYFSFSAVLWHDEEGLLAVKKNILDYQQRAQIVKALTESEAVIIVQRGDKLFFPERRVIVLNDLLAKLEVLPILTSQAPLYGYLDFSEKDLNDFTQILAGYHFTIEKIKDFENNEDLYRIVTSNR